MAEEIKKKKDNKSEPEKGHKEKAAKAGTQKR